MNKKYVLLVLFSLSFYASMACAVCEKQQPKILRGITHGIPGGKSDYIIIFIMVLVTMATLVLSLKWLIRPGEKSTTHIKRFILNEE